MENVWMSAVFLLVGIYYISKYFSKEKKREVYTDILNNEEFKVKGQLER